ncbi:plant auxin-responsive GH3-like protein [Legionella steigerwaltii]|uniref:GH3 auxin-responsive promoter n=1 Tax=Legionella steigerwaltii TaxID=460 RepID=A0A378LE46_9GAMM|nr:GH3 auxin-responsive promoter family protein [Legionella steigerwaltii]KTD78500.1 GH3 auxin-responsive promoter [Legionella steigerwaltii]STY24142.1 plant auxin-responsive GH3-like protein [Legionella steigerwaltii]
MLHHLILKNCGVPIIRNYAKKIEKSAYDPYPYQNAALKKIISTCRRTELGIQCGLSQLKTMDNARKLPSFNYEMLRPEFEKIYREGKKGFFSWEPIKAISLTSGTTGGPKYIPITRNLINNLMRIGFSLFAGLSNELNNPYELFDGKALYLSAQPHIYDSPTALPVGFISGYMNSNRHWLYKDLIYPSKETLSITDAQTRMTCIFEETKDQDIRTILGFPAIIQLVTTKALSYFNVNHLQQLWSNLSVCVYGGNFLSLSQIDYLKKSWLGEVNTKKTLLFLEHYSAAEGFFGHTLHRDWPGLVFNPFDVFYQFKKNRNDAEFVQLHELEEGERYLIYVTTLAGLINYEMEDIIEITSVKPLTFKFFARAKEQISLISEKILVSEIKQVVECLANSTIQPINDFAVYLDCKTGNRLFFILSTPISNVENAIQLLDDSLRKLNPNYNEYRANNTYQPPQVIYKPPEFFNKYREKNIHRGNFKEKRLFMSEAEFTAEYI